MLRVGLTVSQIVEAAADFADSNGWEAIADLLRVKLPTL